MTHKDRKHTSNSIKHYATLLRTAFHLSHQNWCDWMYQISCLVFSTNNHYVPLISCDSADNVSDTQRAVVSKTIKRMIVSSLSRIFFSRGENDKRPTELGEEAASNLRRHRLGGSREDSVGRSCCVISFPSEMGRNEVKKKTTPFQFLI